MLCSASLIDAAEFSTITTIFPASDDEIFIEKAMTFGDLNGDQKTDIVLATYNRRDEDVNLNVFYGDQWTREITTREADVKFRSGGSKDCKYMWTKSDLNGDKTHDLVFVTENVVYVFWGGQLKSFLSRAEANLTIESLDNKKFLAAAVGDVNNDHKADLIVSAQKNGIGYVYVFYSRFLSPFVDINDADLEIVGEELEDGFGEIIEILDDFNNDGYRELLVTSPRGNQRGNVYLFHRPYLQGTIFARHQTDVKIEGSSVGGLFGFYVSPGGDFNGDGKNDLAISAPFDGSEPDQGVIYVYYARGIDLPATVTVQDADSRIFGEDPNDFFGLGFAVLNDRTKNGRDEIVVGSSWSWTPPFQESPPGITEIVGKLYFFDGGNLVNIIQAEWADQCLKGIPDQIWYQSRIFPAGDVNGDGQTDFFVLAYQRINNDIVIKVVKVMTVSP